jgi:hypothetical protein
MIFYKKFIFLLRPLRTRFRMLFFGLYSSRWYPINIRKLHSKIDINVRDDYKIEDLASLLNSINLESKDTASKACLAGTIFSLEELESSLIKETQAGLDSESQNALYRFHWTLEEVIKNEDENEAFKIIKIVQSWFYSDRESAKQIAFQPYNISERICNLTIFFVIVFKTQLISKELLKTYQKFIAKDLEILKDSLEYPASKVINNHILNNARALMLGGFFIGNSSYTELSKEILKTHLPEMIDKNGYLKECSSHYQLLLTRSLIEISSISNFLLDQNFSQWLDDYSMRMVLASRRLKPQEEDYHSDFPNIGDVSPDIPLNWFSLEDNSPTGWNKLWKKPYFFSNKHLDLLEDESWIVLKKGDWFSLNFSHMNDKNYPDGHGHEDFGSFILYFQGRQLIADIGRFTYDDVLESGVSGKEGFSHSIVVLEDSKLKSRHNFFRRHGIVQDNIKRNFKKEEGILNWENRHRKYFWNRTLKINEKTIHIIDNIKAESAKSFFYLSPSCLVKAVNKNKVIVELQDVGNFEFEFKGMEQISVKEVDFFPGYGIKKKTFKLRCEISSKKGLQKVETLITKI